MSDGAPALLLGKPEHSGAARQMLSAVGHDPPRGYRLSACYHWEDGKSRSRASGRSAPKSMYARFAPVTSMAICAARNGEARRGLRAAGLFACFVTAIRGSYENVVGLPLASVLEDLRSAALLPPTWPDWRPAGTRPPMRRRQPVSLRGPLVWAPLCRPCGRASLWRAGRRAIRRTMFAWSR